MGCTGRRPMGRLSCCVTMGMIVLAACGLGVRAFAQGAATTTVADTVYMADGTAAQGNLIITWPAFMTAGGTAIAAGSTNTTLGANGALSVALVPNAGATPAGVYYSVVYQLGPGQVKSEAWVVPATSPANLATVRVTPGAGAAGQPVSMQYVNSALATKADDTGVVHLSGTETINGAKTFATAPLVPAPTTANAAASKGYVDTAVGNVGAGNFLPTAGGTMTGPITLPANPASPMQASTKSYVDSALATKADVIAGVVPSNELGTGTSTSGSCLLGNGSSAIWGACGGGGGTGNVSTTPVANQVIAQPGGTQFSVNNFANIRFVTPSWNWSQTPSDNLGTPGNVTIHLSPCPLGLDTNSSANYYSYKVYISGTGTAEAAPVTGGSCTAGAGSGTITVTTANAHAAGYTVGSASSGIQEAWNDAWVNDYGTVAGALAAPYVKLVADTLYNVYATVYLRGRGGKLDGTGAQIGCFTRDRCIYVGTKQGYPSVMYHTLINLLMSPGLTPAQQAWSNVSSISATSSAGNTTYTIATAAPHAFLVGDMVDCEYNTTGTSGHFAGLVIAAGMGASQFEITISGSASFSAGAYTFGFCHILNAAVEDNSYHVVMDNLSLQQANNVASLGAFTYGVVNDNDQHLILEHASNHGSAVLDLSYPLHAFLYQRTDQGLAGISNVEKGEFTNVNCVTGGGNGLTVTNTICQGFPVFGIRYFGGLQPSTITSLYEESAVSTVNPLYGYGAAEGALLQGGYGHRVVGTWPIGGLAPTFACGTGTAQPARYYWVVPHSSTQGYGPMLYVGATDATTCGGANIPLAWPSVRLTDYAGLSVGTMTWDILMNTTGQAPQAGSANSVAALAAATCGTNGMCTYSDTQGATSAYTVQRQTFAPMFWFWPSTITLNNTTLHMDMVGTQPGIVSTNGATAATVFADQCKAIGTIPLTPIWISCLGVDQVTGGTQTATVLQETTTAGSSPAANSKGRLNLAGAITAPNDLITLQDKNVAGTFATPGMRPANDAGDMAIGLDQADGMALRAAASVSSYINAAPNGANYQERLTSAGKTFNVPVTVNGNLSVTSGTVTLPVTGSGSQCLHVSSAGVVSGTGSDCGSGSGGSVTVNTGTSSQLAMYSGNGSAVSGDTTLMDNGTTLNYSGTGGIAATTATFSGNVNVNGQLNVAGPWMVSSPVPGVAMAAAGAGTSSLGISNDGNFYISASGGTPQKVATAATSSYFSNLFQEDGNDLGMYNGTTAQNLHVYSSYTNSSTWTRTSVGFDAGTGYSVVRSESLPSGGAPGLGFWLNSGIKWAIDPTSNFKPWVNNSYNVGSTTLAPATVYAATSVDTLTQGRLNFELCNDGTSGTSLNFLAKYNGANPACAVKTAATDTDGVIGIVSGGSGTTGNAVITYRGYTQCSFDGTPMLGDYVVASTSNAGDCHDGGTTRPAGVQVIGRVESLNPGSGTYGVRVGLESPSKSSSVPDSTAVPWITAATLSVNALGVSSTANKAAFFGIVLPFQKTTTQITYEVGTADNSANLYDVGIYAGTSGGTCTLQVHIGATAGTAFAPSTGYKTLSWSGGAVTLAPGRYYLAYTASVTSGAAALGASTGTLTFAGGGSAGTWGNVSVSTGGTLPGSVTCPTDSYNSATVPAWAVN